MENATPVKKALKQSTLTLFLKTVSIALIMLSMAAAFYIINSNRKADMAAQARYDLTHNAKRFMEASAYLTNEVRAYAATGNAVYYDNYWNEVNREKNRDIAVENMRSIGITEQEMALVTTMFSLSNNLIPLEKDAMERTQAGNIPAALELVYGAEYLDWITNIRATQSAFIKTLGERTNRELLAEYNNVRSWLIIMIVCLSAAAVIHIIELLVVREKLLRPLVRVRDEMAKIEQGDLHSEFSAMPDTSEMGMLIGSIKKTKAEINSHITDISEKLAAIAEGDNEARIDTNYPGDFVAIKESINAISRILAEQRDRDEYRRKELQTALEEANAANKAKSNFLSSMSHEIRTPLNAILGMTNIALANSDPERRNHCLQKINDASNHLLGVINDILDMSKIDANRFELSPTEFTFEKMMIRVVNIINFRVDEKRQSLNVRIDPNIPTAIVCDDQRLAQVITNLLSNAVKFTPEEGTIAVEVNMLEKVDGL